MSVRTRRSVLAFLLLLAGCARGADGEVRWRDLSLELPDGWVVFEDEPTRLSVANVPLGGEISEEDRPTGDVVAMFFAHREGTTPAAWRAQIEGAGATIELDESIEVGGVPATRIEFLTPRSSGSAETRELVVLIPAREVELLAQPVPLPGSTDAPEVFDRALDDFEHVLASIRWGAPYDGDRER